jgi:hypothetical protein
MVPAGDPGAGRAPDPAAPLVSVVVATYNSRLTLGLALASVCRQTFRDFEVLVIGDGCTDGSGEVVEGLGDPRFRWTNLPRNSGSQAAPNDEGARQARGRWIAYLGHDDLWFPWHLDTLLEAAAAAPVALVHGLGVVLGPDDRIEVTGPPPRGQSWRRHFVPPTNWLVDRETLDRAGGWRDPARLPRPVDEDVLRRLVAGGGTVASVPRLTTIKFPSPWWRLYAPGSPRPQIAVSEAMAADADALCGRLLSAIAQDHARRLHPMGALPPADAWRQAMSAARRAAGATCRAVDETPVAAPLLRWRFQRVRRRGRRLRGLE